MGTTMRMARPTTKKTKTNAKKKTSLRTTARKARPSPSVEPVNDAPLPVAPVPPVSAEAPPMLRLPSEPARLRATMFCENAHEGEVLLASNLTQALCRLGQMRAKGLAPNGWTGTGTAFFQLGEALGDDVRNHTDKVFMLPSCAPLMGITGDEPLVGALALAMHRSRPGERLRLGPTTHEFTSIPTWLVIDGERLVLSNAGLLPKVAGVLVAAGWKVERIDDVMFDLWFSAVQAAS